MIKKTNIITFSISIIASLTTIHTTITETANQASAHTEILEQIRTQHAQHETLLKNMHRDLGAVQKSLRPSVFKHIPRLTVLGLAGYGVYQLHQDYLKSSYKPKVDAKLTQALALFNLIFLDQPH